MRPQVSGDEFIDEVLDRVFIAARGAGGRRRTGCHLSPARACASGVDTLVDGLAQFDGALAGLGECHAGVMPDDDADPLLAPGVPEQPGARGAGRGLAHTHLQPGGRWVRMVPRGQCGQACGRELRCALSSLQF